MGMCGAGGSLPGDLRDGKREKEGRLIRRV